MQTLRQMRLHRAGGKPGWRDWLSVSGGSYLYELPWYVFVGAPGSGKTTALVNSGLSFPLAEKYGPGAIAGVGGTRNCDWWFTDEAVLIDTAGRYTTQDSDQSGDKQAWEAFLDLLKKTRPRRPLNGVVLTLSAADLLQQGVAERSARRRPARPPAGARRAPEGTPAGLRAGHQGRSAARLHGVLRRPGQGPARAGAGLYPAAAGRRGTGGKGRFEFLRA
jgi:hypothetical protein